MAGSDLYTGTLDVLILTALMNDSLHGYGIGRWLRQTSGEVFRVMEGVLYPALHRLQRKGLVKGKWDTTDTGRRAKFYRITSQGREHLSRESEKLTEHSEAVLAVLNTSEV